LEVRGSSLKSRKEGGKVKSPKSTGLEVGGNKSWSRKEEEIQSYELRVEG
jgi:hypothetical protein